MSGDSEEKDQEPTEKRLRDARGRGEVAHFADFQSAAVFAAVAGFLFFRGPSFWDRTEAGAISAISDIGRPFDEAVRTAIATQAAAAIDILAVLALVAAGVAVLVGVILNKGIVFSAEPLVPDLKRLDPIAGIGQKFGMHALVELAKSLLKLIAMGGVIWLLLSPRLGSLFNLPACGLSCLGQALVALTASVLAATLGVYLAIAALDIPLQAWLFRRQMRMSKSEVKRETKDAEGSPEIRAARRDRNREDAELPPGRPSLERATIVIFGGGLAVALRYSLPDTPVPCLMAKGDAENADQLVDGAERMGLPTYLAPDLALSLSRGGRLGGPIRPRDYQGVARALFLSAQGRG